ncbi:MAG: GNAT family N-acetyltransferase [Candidatus Izemoplasmatales bacterium]
MIKTPRLDIFPLTWKELEYITTNISLFEKNTSYFYDGETLSNELISIFSSSIEKVRSYPKLADYHTFWMIILRKTNTVIGSICFKGELSEDLSLEIGYGLGLHYRNHGYMSEAISSFTQYGFDFLGAKTINAQTLKDNIASIRVLQKNDFKLVKQTKKYNYFSLRI